MRAFDPRVVASAVGLSAKAFANLLTRVQLLPPGASGVRRRLAWDEIRALDVTALLARHGVPATVGSGPAQMLLRDGVVELGPGLRWTLDPSAHAQDLERRLAASAERVVAHRRGRPPRRP